MGENIFSCARCGKCFLESELEWEKVGDVNDQSIPFCKSCFGIMRNIRRIEDLFAFAKELNAKWKIDAPHSSEYLKGYISALEIVLALLNR